MVFILESDSLDVNNVDDEWLDMAMRLLTKLLIVPWPDGESPLLYVDNDSPSAEVSPMGRENYSDDINRDKPVKRMKVYRKYPWKRQNQR